MKRTILAAALMAAVAGAVPAKADSISEVESARASERQGKHLTRQEREKLRRYGGNDDEHYSGGDYDGGHDYRGGPSVGIYIGPGYGGYGYVGRRYHRPYGY